MNSNQELYAILDRIANGEETEEDMQTLRQLLRKGGSPNSIQIGKYNVNISEGGNIHIGDRIYQGSNAKTIKEVLRSVLQEKQIFRKQHTRFVRLMLVGFGIGLIVYGLRILFTDGFIFPQAKISLILGWLLLMLICSYYAFFWKRDENYNNETNISKVRDRRRLAALGMVGIPLSTIVVVCLWMNPPTNTIVTFANYYSPKQDQQKVTSSLLNMLQKDTSVQGEKDIEIKPINKAFNGTQEKEATSEGKDRRATISIWGDYTTSHSSGKESVQVNTLLGILKKELVFFLSDQTKDDQFKNNYETNKPLKEIVARQAIKPSELDINVDINVNNNEQEIRQNLAYITNLFAGIALYKSGLTYCDPMSKEAKESVEKSRKYLEFARQRLNYIKENKHRLSQGILKKQIIEHFLTSVSNFYNGNISLSNAYCSNQPNDLNSAIDSFSKAIESIIEYAVTSDNKQNSDIVEYPYSLIPASYNIDGEDFLALNNSYNNQEITCGNKRDKNVMVSNTDSDFNILLSRIYHNRGIAYEMEGDIQKALKDYIQALQLDRETDEFCLSLGSAYANLSNKMRRLAIYYSTYRHYYSTYRHYYSTYRHYYRYYRQLAIRNYNNAEDSLAYYNLGNIYFRERNYGRAIEKYLLAIISDFNFSEAYNNLKIAVREFVRPAFESVGQAFQGVGDAFKRVDVGKILTPLGKSLSHSLRHLIPRLN